MPTLKRVPIWAAETAVDGRQVTEQDVQDVVDSFQEIGPVLKPYIKLGHTENQKILQEDGLPSGGWATRLWREGLTILADFAGVPTVLAELVTKGAYRRVSSEVFHNIKINGKTYRRALRAVAFLGADTPAISSLGDIVALGYASDAEVIAYDTPLTYQEETMQKCKKCGAEYEAGADKCPKCGEMFSAAPGVTVNVNAPTQVDRGAIEAEVAAKFTADLSAKDAALAAAQARIAKFEADKEAERIATFEATVKGLCDAGKLPPALQSKAVAIFRSLNAVSVVTYSVDGKDEKGTPAELFASFLQDAAKLDAFKETLGNKGGETGSEEAPEGVDPESFRIHKATQKYAAEHSVDYATARKAVLTQKEA